MKSWIDQNYDTDFLSLADLRAAVQAAWEAVPRSLLEQLALGMPARLQQCIDRDGYPTDY